MMKQKNRLMNKKAKHQGLILEKLQITKLSTLSTIIGGGSDGEPPTGHPTSGTIIGQSGTATETSGDRPTEGGA